MAKKSGFAVNVEYGALRLACGLVNAIPYPVAMWLASVVAVFAVRVLRFKRARTMERIASVFPEKNKSERLHIAVRSLSNVLQTAVEMIRAPRLNRKWMDRHVVDGQMYKDRLQAYVDEGKGVVIMVPHRNPKIDAWMKRQYGAIEVLERGSAKTLVEVKEKLESGRAFAILPDLRVPQRDVEVDFLGGKANVSHAGAMFAVRCGSPIVVAVMRRENGKHVFDHVGTLRPDPAAGDKKAEAARLTREAMRMLDERIKAHPEHWYWYNKRWLLQPVDAK